MNSVTIDDRCASLRRRLSPLAWRLLEEAALSAAAGSNGALVVSLSVRSVSGLLGVGKQAAAGALRGLIVEGLMVAVPADRRPGGGFPAARYVLRLPVGVAVSGDGVSGSSACGGSAGPGSGSDRGRVAASSSPSLDRCGGGQAQLFGEDLLEGASGAGSDRSPRGGCEGGGASSSLGCEVVVGGHELAPGVPARARRGGGDDRC